MPLLQNEAGSGTNIHSMGARIRELVGQEKGNRLSNFQHQGPHALRVGCM